MVANADDANGLKPMVGDYSTSSSLYFELISIGLPQKNDSLALPQNVD